MSCKNSLNKLKMRVFDTLLTILSFFIIGPAITIILLLLSTYRCIVNLILKIQLKDKYAGLLSGTDSVWAIEEASSLAVINILVILEKDAKHSNITFLEDFRSLVSERMIGSPFDKLLYVRKRKFGYYYWEKGDKVNLEERVRWLEYERRSCDGSCDNIYNGHLKRILRNVCNQPLPENNMASWEILIGKSCPRSSYHYLRRMEERQKNGRIKIPILFRVHHSLGDGPALLKFFLESMVDKEPFQTCLKLKDTVIRNADDLQAITVNAPPLNYAVFPVESNLLRCRQEDVFSASMPFVHFKFLVFFGQVFRYYLDSGVKYWNQLTMEIVKNEIQEFGNKKWSCFKQFMDEKVLRRMKVFSRIMMTAVIAPACFIRQAQRSMDESLLHGPQLCGEKVVSYWLEDDFRNSYEERLQTKIQKIKYITDSRFVDVFLAALSASLHKHYLRMNEPPPETISVVLPERIEELCENLPLQNNFSVGVLSLCISNVNGEESTLPTEDTKILERLEDIKGGHFELKTGPDYMVNFLVMKYLAAALPETILRPLLESHSTMVLSNIIGPQEVRILGHVLKNIAFWIPNRSFTGIGCSLLTYRGYLHLSLAADKMLVPDEKYLTEILENTVREIDNLYDKLTLSNFSKRLHGSISTPTKEEKGVL